ncbi:MAG: four helix bundle protein [Desulfosarcina sp.]|nr:four helix bundle protein [Desulfosarcina sp.]MBC2767827.1 four helix bundle protein [Desulfosarcina sp.]
MRDFRKLNVWEKAHHFTLQVYRITKNFPSDERFGLTVQILKNSVECARLSGSIHGKRFQPIGCCKAGCKGL